MTLNLLLDCSNNEDKVNNLSENFIFNVVTETPVNEHFLALGHKVIACEQSKILFILLLDAIERAKDQLPFIDNLKLLNGNSTECFKDYTNIDVIYLDPMYPEPKKNVLRSGNIARIKEILQIEMITDQGDDIFYEFKEYDFKKIILKRPIKSELLDSKFNYQIKGKSTRFDVYI